MRTVAFVFVTVALSVAFTAAYAQEAQFPKDGNGLLDYCNHVVNLLDAQATQKTQDDTMKIGWCLGYIDASEERISNWRVGTAIETLVTQKAGKPAPSRLWADEDFAGICLPDGVSLGQVARVLVQWLRQHPERLHEAKSLLVMAALKDAFPCQVAKEPGKPSAKPQP
jgi:hypothetical protein